MLTHSLTAPRHTRGTKCDNNEDQLLTFNQLLELVSDPLTGPWLWPTSQCQTPVGADWRQHGESSTLRTSGLARLALRAALIKVRLALRPVRITVISLKVSHIDHQERSHQHHLQHLQRQIIQHLQQQHHRDFHSAEKHVLSIDCPTNLLTSFQRQDSTMQSYASNFAHGLQLAATVYNNKVKEHGAPWWRRCKFLLLASARRQ